MFSTAASGGVAVPAAQGQGGIQCFLPTFPSCRLTCSHWCVLKAPSVQDPCRALALSWWQPQKDHSAWERCWGDTWQQGEFLAWSNAALCFCALINRALHWHLDLTCFNFMCKLAQSRQVSLGLLKKVSRWALVSLDEAKIHIFYLLCPFVGSIHQQDQDYSSISVLVHPPSQPRTFSSAAQKPDVWPSGFKNLVLPLAGQWANFPDSLRNAGVISDPFSQ